MTDILAKIAAYKRADVDARKAGTPLAEIEARLARNAAFAEGLAPPLRVLDNSASLETSVRGLLALLEDAGLSAAATPG